MGWTNDEQLQELTQRGILKEPEGFSCPAAQAYYKKNFYAHHPEEAPGSMSIEELIKQAVQSISMLALQQAEQPAGQQSFSKEDVFQHLFHEAMMKKLLPPRNSICPEFNSFVQKPNKMWSLGELDFYINMSLKLLRRGHKASEHVDRFDPTIGKYCLIPYIFLLWTAEDQKLVE
jgi:hypothetical protein